MLRRSVSWLKISKVAINTSSTALAYTHNYRKNIDYNLSKRFAQVDNKNRFEALRIVFGEKLNGHVARRQYKLQCAGKMTASIVEPLEKYGIDWHDLKGLGRAELLDVCDLLGLDSSSRTIFLTAVESKMCGVLTRSGKDRNPRTICTKPGRLQHGWRCGHNGHSHNTYFEGKADAIPSEIASLRSQGFLGLSNAQRQMMLTAGLIGNSPNNQPLRLPRGPTSLNNPATVITSTSSVGFTGKSSPAAQLSSTYTNDELLAEVRSQRGIGGGGGGNEADADEEEVVLRHMENGIQVEHRKAPDFSIVGRHQERQIFNPRVWTSPTNPTFNVSVMGFEMRVHPDDPRAIPQILNVHKEWAIHGEVVKHVVWEMLELYGVERPPQSLDMEEGELGEPDSIFSFSSAFWGSSANETAKSSFSGDSAGEDGTIDPADVAIERRMLTSNGDSVPWFSPPLPQHFKRGVPEILPFAPTLIIRGVYRQVSEVVSMGLSEGGDGDGNDVSSRRNALLEKRLHYPLMDISVLRHPDACFWWNAEDEEKAIEHILGEARKVPFALPFNLYIRVDPSRALRRHFVAGAKTDTTSAAEEKVASDVGPLSEAFASDFYLEMKRRQEDKKKYFDLQNFRASAWLAADPKGGVIGADLGLDSEELGDADMHSEPIFGARTRRSGEVRDGATLDKTDGEGDQDRHPESYDMEVHLDNRYEEDGGSSRKEAANSEKVRTSQPDTKETERVPEDDDTDELFPDVNPPGWS